MLEDMTKEELIALVIELKKIIKTRDTQFNTNREGYSHLFDLEERLP